VSAAVGCRYSVRVPLEERRLEAELRSVSRARAFVRDMLTSWSLGDLEWVAAQVVSELATNAVIHARTAFTVGLSFEDGVLRVSVSDRSPRQPVRRRYSDEATTGRGLALIERLAGAWGVAAGIGGKTVWCDLRFDASVRADEPDLDALLEMFGGDADEDRPTEAGGPVLAMAA